MPDLGRDLSFYPTDNPSPVTLTPDQIRQYNERGYVFPLDVFSPAEIATHRAYFDKLMEKATAAGWNSYSINGWQAKCTGIYDLVNEPRVLDYVEDLLGENLICWATHYFCKMPGDTKRVAYHQDASYWPLSPSKTVTVWLAIDDVDLANGAMQFVAGSHRDGQIAFEWSKPEEENVLSQSVHDPEEHGAEEVAIEMTAGQISLHSDLLLHGSEPNASDRRRCGLTMRFAPPDVKPLNSWGGTAIICRGRDTHGHWTHNERPETDDIPQRAE
ncbi:phytanoyl-CoA dioxygenase family protein [Candidatus Poribacteria bacterium]|nr:phytanoyl-CoA dioxygenase family protein [Candidatus Poribacteria bacterium]MBT5531842.1 phytanoyl-CoA dioxygenase family protein [Candidatus Poribacteria bacterium]MBT7096388.1 phytanoyl-CoA dioxygenase family protein [Candidatus Poribacteria bacterium]MBT7807485.1 phytanoyl-CoA dioxygenase family protein [Candidatus Poribacteria bacterium]